MTKTLAAPAAIGLALGCAGAHAQFISPVSAMTDDPILFGDPANVIDGVIDVDSNIGIGNATAGLFAGPYTVTFDLGRSYTLTGMRLWNNAGSIENDGEGIDAFALRFFDLDGVLVGTFDEQADDLLAPQDFAFLASGVRTVELEISSNHAPTVRDYAAFHEIAFVPAPGAGVVLMGGLLASRGRR